MLTFKLFDPRHFSGLARSRSTLIVLVLLLALGLAGLLAYEAQQAARSHRATAENVLRDYAAFATWEFSRVTKRELSTTFSSTMARLEASAGTPSRLSGALAAIRNGTDSCGGKAFRTMRGVFYVDLPHAVYTEAGEPLPVVLRNRLTSAYDHIRAAPRDYDCPLLTVEHGGGGRPIPVVWQVLWNHGGEPRRFWASKPTQSY